MTLKLSFKLCIVGNQGVGKTSLIIRYVENKFRENYIPTLGVDFLTKKVIVGSYKTPVNLILWDIGGDIRWKKRIHIYLRGADGVIVVYDITRKTTFKSLDFWLEKIKENAGEVPFLVVGNKKDLEAQRNVQFKQVEEYLKDKGSIGLMESSAKTGETVNDMFLNITEKIVIAKAKHTNKK
ncbi:MAG: Rab family GTPase [Candidatus Helarchaeota archaeon]